MIQRVIIKIIRIYQKYISPDSGVFHKATRKTCVFYPTCSEYTVQALIKYGVLKGLYLSIKRVFRCHPWQKNHIDPLS